MIHAKVVKKERSCAINSDPVWFVDIGGGTEIGLFHTEKEAIKYMVFINTPKLLTKLIDEHQELKQKSEKV